MTNTSRGAGVSLLGVRVSPVNPDIARHTVRRWVSKGAARYVCVSGVHGLIESYAQPRLRSIHNRAGMVVPDGMPLVWLSRLAGSSSTRRVYGPDLMLTLCQESVAEGWRHFFYGSTSFVVNKLQAHLEQRFPGILIAGSYCPPFRPLSKSEDREVIAQIRAAQPQLVWVGLSTPKQEYWMAEHVDRLGPCVQLGVGAAFDFLAGTKRQAPVWMQKSGLEWFFRLLTEPRRLGPRYLKNNPRFVALMALQLLRSLTHCPQPERN